MEDLEELKVAVLMDTDPEEAIERCYKDLIENYEYRKAVIFYNLLRITNPTKRTAEILKVMDFVRFPVKKSIDSVI